MRMRKDARTPDPRVLTFRNYPMVKHYKYLGVTLDNSLNLKMELHRKKQLDDALRQQKMRIN